MTDQLRDKFKKLRLEAEMKERDAALALSAAEKAKRAEEAARDAALDGVVISFKNELPDAVALLAEVGVAAHVDGAVLVVGAKTLTCRRVGLTIVIEENGRPAGMLEHKKSADPKDTHVIRSVSDGKPFEGWPERLSRYLDRIVTEQKRA